MAYGQVALSARGPGAALNFPVERVQESLRVLALGGGYGARALPARRRSSTARTGSLSPELYATSTFFPCSKARRRRRPPGTRGARGTCTSAAPGTAPRESTRRT
jgi:hypothetical protein